MNRKTGGILALFGPDGSGKSTIADVLEKKCKNADIHTSRMHWRPGFLPYRGRINGSDNKEDFTNPHTYRLRRGPKAWLIFLYIVMDFLLGHIFIIRPKLKRGAVIIYERYYYDILMDQKRYGLCVPTFISRIIARTLIPVPDIIVLLDAPADTLYARKQELPCVEIEHQRRKMKSFFHHFSNCHIVDVERNKPEQVADIILTAIDSE